MNRYLEKFREVQRGMSLRNVLTIEWVAAVQDAIAALARGENLKLEGGLTRGIGTAGVSIGTRRARRGWGGGGGAAGPCPFGEIETWTEGEGEAAVSKTGLRGGMVYCGDKNFAVERQELDTEVADNSWLVYLEIDCEANMDDDGELILSGIKTCSETNPASFWEKDTWAAGPPATQYQDNDNPTVASSGSGTIRVPLGRLTIKDGAYTFAATGCGNVTIGQCGGTLSHARG